MMEFRISNISNFSKKKP